jgi:hypothetical protein
MDQTEGEAIPVTGREGPQGCEMLRLPHFLDNRLTDCNEVVGLMRRLLFTPRRFPGTRFRIILKGILKNKVGSCGLVSFGSKEGPETDSCEYDTEPLGSIKY